MENDYIEESVRRRLILSGLSELCEHGVAEFSLRRAALGAQVSCAAPYRHFKDKDAYIVAIIGYVHTQWELLCREIRRLYADDTARLCVELCVASMRFHNANTHIRAALSDTEGADALSFDEQIVDAVRAYAAERGLSASKTDAKIFFARVLVTGAVALMTDEDHENVLSLARENLCREFV